MADVNKVWREAFRVLKPGGSMVAGMCNRVMFTVDLELEKQGIVQMRYPISYSDSASLTAQERQAFLKPNDPLSFGHTLADQIGGQLRAGFVLTDMFEDSWDPGISPIHRYLDCFLATRAVKPQRS